MLKNILKTVKHDCDLCVVGGDFGGAHAAGVCE